MKKSLLFLLFVPNLVFSQSYSFSEHTDSYKKLPIDKRIVLSDTTKAWNWVYNDAIIDFGNSIFTIQQDTFDLGGNTISIVSDDKKSGASIFIGSFPNNMIIDKNFDSNKPFETPSISRVSYLIEGNKGKRIAKIEFDNVKFSSSEDKDSLFYQLWLYEEDESIEMHFGNSVVNTSFEKLSQGPPSACGYWTGLSLYTNSKDIPNEDLFLTDANGGLNVTNKISDACTKLFPENGKVYRFKRSFNTTAPTHPSENLLSIYPNPASSYFTIDFPTPKPTSTLAILDLTGRTIIQQSISNQKTNIPIESLINGLYLIKLDDGVRTQTTRLLKQN